MELIKETKSNNKFKNGFLNLMDELYKKCNSVVKKTTFFNEGIRELTINTVKIKLFSSYQKDEDSARKLGNNTNIIDSVNIWYLLINLINPKSKNDEKESLFKNPFEILFGVSDIKKIHLEDVRSLYRSVKELYDKEPFSWYDFETELKKTYAINIDISSDKITGVINNENISLFRFYCDAFSYCLILLIVYKGLYHNNIDENEENEKNTIQEFQNMLTSNNRIVFKSGFRAGKTTFLKKFSSINYKKVHYFDSMYKEIKKEKITLAIRPFSKLWTEVKEIKTMANEYKKLHSLLYLNDERRSLFFCNVSSDDVLIIDNISKENIGIINQLNDLKCKVVFVPDMSADTSMYRIKEYFYDNSEKMLSLFSSVYTGQVELNEKSFEILKKQLGSDVLVYDLVARSHKIYSKKCGFNLIQKLLNSKCIDDYYSDFKEISCKRFSYNYAHEDSKSVSRNLENHITTIYSDYFGDVDKKLSPSKDRSNCIQLHLLRLLCRLKNKDISYSEVKRVWNFSELIDGEKNIYTVIENLGWVKKDRICIPDFIAYAFNRKNLINEVQYYEELGIRHALNYFTTHQSYAPTNCVLYNALFECFLEDYCYLQDRAKEITCEHDKEIRRIIKKNDKIVSEKLKEDFESAKSEVVLDKFLLLSFLLETLTFSLKYNKANLWKEAKKILEQKEPDTLLLGLVNKFDDNLNTKPDALVVCDLDSYQHDGSALILLMESFLYFLNKEALRIIKNINLTNNKKVLEVYSAKNKILKYVPKFYEVIECFKKLSYRKDIKGKDVEYKESILRLSVCYKLICKTYENGFVRFNVENITDYLQEMKEYHNSGKLNTRIYENLIVLICISIMNFSVSKELDDIQRKNIENLVIDLTLYEECAGDLPINISEIVKTTKEFLLENNLLD